MEHGMAIRANRNQVVYRINLILASNIRKLPQMMYMNKSIP